MIANHQVARCFCEPLTARRVFVFVFHTCPFMFSFSSWFSICFLISSNFLNKKRALLTRLLNCALQTCPPLFGLCNRTYKFRAHMLPLTVWLGNITISWSLQERLHSVRIFAHRRVKFQFRVRLHESRMFSFHVHQFLLSSLSLSLQKIFYLSWRWVPEKMKQLFSIDYWVYK